MTTTRPQWLLALDMSQPSSPRLAGVKRLFQREFDHTQGAIIDLGYSPEFATRLSSAMASGAVIQAARFAKTGSVSETIGEIVEEINSTPNWKVGR